MPVVWEHDPIGIQSEYRPIVLVKIQYYWFSLILQYDLGQVKVLAIIKAV